MVGEPRHRVNSRLITVDILGLDFTSPPTLTLPGVLDMDVLGPENVQFILVCLSDLTCT